MDSLMLWRRTDKGRSSTRARYVPDTSTSGTYPIYVSETRVRRTYRAYLAVRRGAGVNESMNLRTRLRIHVRGGRKVGRRIRIALLVGATAVALSGCGPDRPSPTPSTTPATSATSAAPSPSPTAG